MAEQVFEFLNIVLVFNRLFGICILSGFRSDAC